MGAQSFHDEPDAYLDMHPDQGRMPQAEPLQHEDEGSKPAKPTRRERKDAANHRGD